MCTEGWLWNGGKGHCPENTVTYRHCAEIVVFLASMLVRGLQVCVSSLGRRATYVYIAQVVSVQGCSFATRLLISSTQ